jgi:hypothetical protein
VPEVYVNVLKTRGETIVAICDKELLGKKFKDQDKNIVFEVRESFYRGSKMKLEDAMDFLKIATIANLTGPKIVEKAIKLKFIHPLAVIKIAGIPHAQIVKM